VNLFQNAAFLLSVGDLRQLPPDRGAEIAFAGRSNAGKSSAINAICARRKLAFVSRTPGRTQVINFYAIAEQARLVDLPGYGYAKAPADMRSHWVNLIGTYLQRRNTLQALVIIMDARHPLMPLDRQMLEWYSTAGRPIAILLTKADKLRRQAAQRQLQETRDYLSRSFPQATAQLFSSVTGEGVEEAREALERLLDLPRAGKARAEAAGR